MTERELKRLSRVELLGLLLDEVKKNDALEAQVKDLQEQLAERATIEAVKTASEQCLEGVQSFSEKQDALAQKLEAGLSAQENWQQINERLDAIMKEQREFRRLIFANGKGSRR